MSAPSEARPAITVALVTPDRFDRIRKTVRCLRTQSASRRIELIVCAPSLHEMPIDPAELDGFHSHQLLEVGPIRSVGAPRADAVLAATAPAIVFGEDHSFPQAGWAEAMIDAFRSGRAAVGATLFNANSGSAISWASCLLNFGSILMRSSSFDSTLIPWHNSGYRIDLLRRYAREDLIALLETEGLLHARLIREGFPLYLCGDARAAHANVSRLASLCGEQFYGSRLFCHHWARLDNWPVWKRMLFAAAAPGLGLLRLVRAVTEARRVGITSDLPRLLPLLAMSVTCIALGGIAGMLPGLGNTMPYRISTEFHRERHLREQDRAVLVE